ncbi:MAG TPA: AMP-binding protein, partial [Chitinophagaceae bacterium]|nr:AMP-binding protein [Chitinophagaceae bacterium]
QALLHDVAELEISWYTETKCEKHPEKTKEGASYPDIAYILFTSGSTGYPKGVPVSHRNLDGCLNFFLRHYDFNEEDRFLQVYNTTFDVFYFSFIMPLMVGACCYFVNGGKAGLKYLQIFKALQQYKITVVSMVPTLLLFAEKYLNQFTYPYLRYSFFSGDALLHAIATKWKRCFPNGALHNFYGPTETTIVCTRYVWEEGKSLEESHHDVVPLGIPFEGMQYLLINDQHQTVSKGEIGELAFTGIQVIEQYVDNEHSDKFFIDSSSGLSYYKTGDLAFVNQRGSLVFSGRKDFQHKVHGYRIELAEVELAISSIVQQPCYAVVHRNKSGLNVLYAMVLKHSMSEKEIVAALKQKVPHYMIPRRILQLEEFPVNSNNKVDRLLLNEIVYNVE